MKRLVPTLIAALLLAGCSHGESKPPGTNPPAPPATPPAVPSTAAPQPDPRPDLLWGEVQNLSVADLQQGLLRLIDEPGASIPAQLNHLFAKAQLALGTREAVPWVEADLDGNGETEFALALPVHDKGAYYSGAALFVIHRQDGRYVVDASPLTEQSPELMAPYLHGAADLTGEGRPQLIWYRPELIATGPQPYAVFVTKWQPGTFTHLPGPMMISNLQLSRAERELRLTGVSREGRILWWQRTDTYRFVDGAFRLVDRRFLGERSTGYDRFWDGLTSEGVGQLDRAELAYRAVLEPERPAHPGAYPRYNAFPLEPTAAELVEFTTALRTFARFRLGALYLGMGRPEQAKAILGPTAGSYDGLLQVVREARNCQAAIAWAEQNPGFLGALNRAITHKEWTPSDLCTYPSIDESI